MVNNKSNNTIYQDNENTNKNSNIDVDNYLIDYNESSSNVHKKNKQKTVNHKNQYISNHPNISHSYRFFNNDSKVNTQIPRDPESKIPFQSDIIDAYKIHPVSPKNRTAKDEFFVNSSVSTGKKGSQYLQLLNKDQSVENTNNTNNKNHGNLDTIKKILMNKGDSKCNAFNNNNSGQNNNPAKLQVIDPYNYNVTMNAMNTMNNFHSNANPVKLTKKDIIAKYTSGDHRLQNFTYEDNNHTSQSRKDHIIYDNQHMQKMVQSSMNLTKSNIAQINTLNRSLEKSNLYHHYKEINENQKKRERNQANNITTSPKKTGSKNVFTEVQFNTSQRMKNSGNRSEKRDDYKSGSLERTLKINWNGSSKQFPNVNNE